VRCSITPNRNSDTSSFFSRWFCLFTARLGWLRGATAFTAPVIARQVLVIYVNVTSANFRGVTSTLGYSLFDHAQQLLTRPNADPDPHVRCAKLLGVLGRRRAWFRR
jgi:hypothetical protein